MQFLRNNYTIVRQHVMQPISYIALETNKQRKTDT